MQRQLRRVSCHAVPIAILHRREMCEKIQLMRQDRELSINALSQPRRRGLGHLHVMPALCLADLPQQDRQKRNARRYNAKKQTFHMHCAA